MNQNVRNIRQAASPISNSVGAGSGDGGSGMEARIAKLEAHVEHLQSDVSEIKSDVKLLTASTHQISESIASAKVWAVLLYIGLAAVMLGVMAKGFGWLK